MDVKREYPVGGYGRAKATARLVRLVDHRVGAETVVPPCLESSMSMVSNLQPKGHIIAFVP